MADLPIIPDCFRIDVNWPIHNGVRPHNTFHIRTALTDVQQISDALDAAFDGSVENPWGAMHEAYTTHDIDITPLAGAFAAVPCVLDFPFHGNQTGDMLPSTAVVVSIRSAHRGASGRGRLYVGPTTESVVQDGLVDSDNTDAMLTAWQAIALDLSNNATSIALGVASYKNAAFYPYTGFKVPEVAATQRRRQDQLRR